MPEPNNVDERIMNKLYKENEELYKENDLYKKEIEHLKNIIIQLQNHGNTPYQYYFNKEQ